MNVSQVRTDADRDAALLEIERLWDAKVGTPEASSRESLLAMIEAYEEEHPRAEVLHASR